MGEMEIIDLEVLDAMEPEEAGLNALDVHWMAAYLYVPVLRLHYMEPVSEVAQKDVKIIHVEIY